jgi:RNA polymerase sigma factor (sigma-70 family)
MFDTLLNHPLLALDQEIALGHRIQAGDKDALDEMVCHNLRLVYQIARHYYTADPGTTFDDLVQEGMLGLLTAARRYYPERRTRFSTYASYWIEQKIRRTALTAGSIPRSDNPNYPHVRPAAIRAHALRQSPIARLDAPLVGRKGDDSLNTLADILVDDSTSVEDQALSNIEFERIFAALRLNPRGQAIVRDWLSGISRRDAQQMHGVSNSWLSTTLVKCKEKIMPPRTASNTCIEPGCDQPRYINPKGTTLPRCHEHQKQFWRGAAKAQTAATRPVDPPPAPVGSLHEAPPHDDCSDCIYREVVALLAARNPRIAELVDAMQTARRLRDDLGI